MNRKELARRLGVTPNTIWRWEKASKSPVKPKKIRGGRLTYAEGDFETLSAWMAETEPAPIAEPKIEEFYLGTIEKAHRSNCGTNRQFCYSVCPVIDGGEMYRITVVEQDVSGHWPITEDFLMGSEHEMRVKANDLNRRRLDISPRQAALIIASSMGPAA